MDPDKSTENFVLVVNGSDLGRTTHKDATAPTLSEPIVGGDKIKEEEPSMGLGNASDKNVVNVRITRQRDNHNAISLDSAKTTMISSSLISPLIWSWPHEHADRKREREADEALHGRHGSTHYIYGSHSVPFEVDRKLLKDLVREKMGEEVGRIEFLSAGSFHKAYLVTLTSHRTLITRVARRFMPRLKTSSEVATMAYLRERSKVPVPLVFNWDANPYNRLGGEFIFMQKATGIPLSKVYHGLSYTELLGLLRNLAALIIPLFAHRFDSIGSLYFGHNPAPSVKPENQQAHVTSMYCLEAPTPKPPVISSGYPLSLSRNTPASSKPAIQSSPQEFHIGPIISWPFFGSNRGELTHPTEINRGPWSTTSAYLSSCAHREISSVIMENEGRCAPHKLHLDPDEIRSSRYHRLRKVDGDESDDSDEWELEESEEDEWEGPGDLRYDYGDYRRMQRSAFLLSVLKEREDKVKDEMRRWGVVMERLRGLVEKGNEEEFALDCHDLSLENVFVDETDHTRITCIIDWESTTTRPLWAAAHLPAFIQSSPFVAKLFRKVVANLASDPNLEQSVTLPSAYIAKHSSSSTSPLNALCAEWLYYEARGISLRMVHRCAEWDGWEEGLVDSLLGTEEDEEAGFRGCEDDGDLKEAEDEGDDTFQEPVIEVRTDSKRLASISPLDRSAKLPPNPPAVVRLPVPPIPKRHMSFAAVRSGVSLPPVSQPLLDSNERAKEKMLDVTGDICGGRGGELGRRLEAWLCASVSEVVD